MNRDETIELWLEGKEAWNEWANEMLARRKALEEAGVWEVSPNGLGILMGNNQFSRDWLDEASADFAGVNFGEYKQAIPVETITDYVDRPDVSHGFMGLKFPSTSNFVGASFSGYVCFECAEFHGYADFEKSHFENVGGFENSDFFGNAVFSSAKFSELADFEEARFHGEAGFERISFSSETFFSSAVFSKVVNFALAKFDEPVFWNKAEFHAHAIFRAISSEKSFVLKGATFCRSPNFLETVFHTPPILDDCDVVYRHPTNEDDHRYFRTLRKMADDGGDHIQAMRFFADEQRARRHWVDKPFGQGMARYWAGIGYQAVSDFGRSFMRPLCLWIGSLIIFAGAYQMLAVKVVDGTFPSLYLSLRHGLIVSGLTRTGKLADEIEALFGKPKDIPDAASLAMLVQPLISAIFIFFMLLALRNHFRIGR